MFRLRNLFFFQGKIDGRKQWKHDKYVRKYFFRLFINLRHWGNEDCFTPVRMIEIKKIKVANNSENKGTSEP